jgi:hypothetical protein
MLFIYPKSKQEDLTPEQLNPSLPQRPGKPLKIAQILEKNRFNLNIYVESIQV